MGDRMMQRRDASLRDLRRSAKLPARQPEESFRVYYRRVALGWLATTTPRDARHERTVRLILAREDLRDQRSLQRRQLPGSMNRSG